MAPHPAKRNTGTVRRQDLVSKNLRRSVRLRTPQERFSISKPTNTEPKHTPLSSSSDISEKEIPQSNGQKRKRKRKRSQEDEAALPFTTTTSQKRPWASPPRSAVEDTVSKNAAVGVSGKEINPVEY
ncbi:hypothetical protein MMC25_001959 [Agyrium rufum]|nr:hypothetical protein [Agyrium rufum]